jgi:uncharacterized protein YndB with AHSA1/START domain
MSARKSDRQKNDMALVFKALADESRRQILDIVKGDEGISVNGVAEHFEFSRFAVMKHLRILEEANLLRIEKDGRFRKIHINAIPIQMIYDRWLSQYSRHWASGLTRLKYELESKAAASTSVYAAASLPKGFQRKPLGVTKENVMEKEIKQVYVMYIRASIEKLWDALVKAELTPEWFAGMAVKFEPKVGAALTYEAKGPDGNEMALVKGKVLELEPKKKLAYTFSLQVDEKVRADKESRVKYELEPSGDSIKLTVTHDQFETETPSYHGTSAGWPMHLSTLKTWVETGKALELPRMH